jgi:uncharacterized protein YndB with AHSA1/START domain
MTTKDLSVTRTFDAPVAQVWQAWVDPEYVMQWWAPTGFTSPLAKMDVREGGASLVCMRTPDGHDLYNTWTYDNIEPLKQLDFMLHFADKDGNPINPTDIGLPPGVPHGVRHAITFRDLGDNRTEMTVNEYGYASDEIVAMSKMGLEQCLDKMEAIFAATHE